MGRRVFIFFLHVFTTILFKWESWWGESLYMKLNPDWTERKKLLDSPSRTPTHLHLHLIDNQLESCYNRSGQREAWTRRSHLSKETVISGQWGLGENKNLGAEKEEIVHRHKNIMNQARIHFIKKIKAGWWDSALWATLAVVTQDVSEELIGKLSPGIYGKEKNNPG